MIQVRPSWPPKTRAMYAPTAAKLSENGWKQK